MPGSALHSFALKSNGEAWGWGKGSESQLGFGGVAGDRSSPVSVVGGHLFTQIATGGDHTLGLKSDGSVWAWGDNLYGQQGGGISGDQNSPVSVVGNHSFTYIGAGLWHSAALKADGTVWTWGRNDQGQLGDNSLTNRDSPVQVVGAHSFTELSAGHNHNAALKSDGTVWTWGDNTTYGQLGDNSTTNRSSPVSVVGAHSFIELSTGGRNTYALKSDGSAWAWGNGTTWGGNGDNSATNRSSPVSVVGAHSFIEISASTTGALALKNSGEVWGWGFNLDGRIGDGTTTEKSSPVSVIGAHSFVGIAAGQGHGLGRKNSGEVWAWGRNVGGELGDWTTTNRSSPVVVVGSV